MGSATVPDFVVENVFGRIWGCLSLGAVVSDPSGIGGKEGAGEVFPGRCQGLNGGVKALDSFADGPSSASSSISIIVWSLVGRLVFG